MDQLTRSIRRISDSIWTQLTVAAVITAVFMLFVYKTAPSLDLWWARPAALLFSGIFALALVLVIAIRRFNALELLGTAACVGCAIYARVALLPFESGDFTQYLLQWFKELGSLSVKDALSTPIGNYNLPYIYYLTILSRFNAESLVHIKAFSCLFDVIMAYAVMRLVMTEVEDKRLQLAAYIIVLLSPTVMIDSAMWAQCDSVYTALCIISAFAAVRGRGRLCAISWTAAFCFKLQAVFILPALAAALFMGKVKPKHLLWIPAVYFISILPALIAGRSLADCLNIYTNQVGYYKGLFFNAPTVWRFFGDAQIPELTNMSVYPAMGALILFTLYAISAVKSMDNNKLISLFFISALLAAFLLPRMHERYFYMAEVLSIAYFTCDRRKWYVPAILTAASLSSYMEYFLVYSMSSYEEYMAKTVGIKPVYFAAAILVILAMEGRALFGGTVRTSENLE